ncbi:nuclear transcription factor Y subunit C-2-like protein [Carex littledalei]|uniref:Nuclear transcription factor Y subunit C-2-like protein n=1 Tax=Carex littledalei TaxID=544730 RepID=A0A833VJP7_9POAL|nr:nuclear transcription factor Y subunit C-2-like protein [Carex littledalei]
MDQTPQPSQPVMGMVTAGPAQMPYPVPTYSPASMVSGAPAIIGTHPSAPQAGLNPAGLPTGGAHHHNQLAFQQVQQFHQQQQQHQQQQLQSFWASQMAEIDQTNDFKNHSLPLARIKKIMKADEDVRMISAEAPVVFAKACELFILELTLRAWIHTEENKRRTLQKNDIAAAITRTDIFDFLVDIVPRDELKDEGLGMPRGAIPGMVPGAGEAGMPYYYVPVQSGMIMGKPMLEQGAGGVGSGVGSGVYGQGQVAYMWPQGMQGGPQGQAQGQEAEQSDD